MTQTYTPEIEALGEQIVSLSLIQAAELKKYMKEKYGIEPSGHGLGILNMPIVGIPINIEDTPTVFDIIFKGLADPAKKVSAIKEIRAITGLGLKESKDFIEGPEKPIKEAISKEEAEKIKTQLEAAGVKIELK